MKFLQFMNPSVNPDTEKEMDTASLKSIRMISLIGLVFEVAAAIVFFVSIRGKIDNDALISGISISFSVILCIFAFYQSKLLLKEKSILPG